MGLQIEDDITSTVKSLLSAFTSEMGLGYGRLCILDIAVKLILL